MTPFVVGATNEKLTIGLYLLPLSECGCAAGPHRRLDIIQVPRYLVATALGTLICEVL